MLKPMRTSSTRAVRLFEAFAAVGAPKSLSEIAELLETPLSTCHGLVRSLRDGGYLYVNAKTRHYYPTRRLLQVAETIAANDPVAKYFDLDMAALRDQTDETVILGTMAKHAVVYLSVLESRSTIRYSARPGDIKPLHSSALGKLVLGEASDQEREAIIGALSLEAITENTLTSPATLRRDLALSRSRGLYVTCGENVSDVMAIAAPTMIGGQCYGLAVAGPIERIQRKRDIIEKALLETCAKIAQELK